MYLLGVDNGSTVAKAALFDLNGREVQVASRRIATSQSHPGWVERNMQVVWQQTAEAIYEVIQRAGIAPADIAGVGCTGHGNGIYPLDAAGNPFENAIHALDMRAASTLAEWTKDGTLRQARQYTHQQAYAGQTAVLLGWLKKHQPEQYAAIGTVLLCKDYINYCLTGAISTDFSDISCTNLLDVTSSKYRAELLALYDLAEAAVKLPQPQASSTVIGHITKHAAELTGLKAGTPVIAGMIDLAANAVGTGTIQAGQACIVAGTWSINQVITETVVTDDEIFLNCFSADPSRYLVVEGSATSTTNLEWFVNEFCAEEKYRAAQEGVSVYDLCNALVAQTPIDASHVIFHPFLYGSNVQANARAGFYGMAGWHTRAHLLRALYEGIVFGHLSHIQKLRQVGARFEKARLTGGAARSEVWAQMFADIVQVPLEIVDSEETGTRGAALTAGVGAGIYENLADAAQCAVSSRQTYTPDATNTVIYMKRFEAYQQIVEAMRSPWDLLNQMNE